MVAREDGAFAVAVAFGGWMVSCDECRGSTVSLSLCARSGELPGKDAERVPFGFTMWFDVLTGNVKETEDALRGLATAS